MTDAATKEAAKDTKQAEADVKAAADQRAKTNAETMERQDKSKPTPTQEENDQAAAGIPVELEYDGSPPQGTTTEEAVAAAKHYKQPEDSAHVGARKTTEEERKRKQSEAKPSGGAPYQTRAATPAKP